MSRSTSIPFPINSDFPTFTQKTASADVVIWVDYANGSNSNTGTSDAPVKHLRVAMDLARNYILTEDALLYVRLKAGEHALDNQPVDLFHPQGDRVIVEGDPSAFRQRVLWGVEEYTWSIANFAGGGHTGTVRLFDAGNTAAATSAPGVTLHGFTATNVGQFFCITNAEQGSRGGMLVSDTNFYNSSVERLYTGIRDDGNSRGSPPRHTRQRIGDTFFNHGLSFEDANCILGIGRIRDASSSVTLGVEFRNLNIDSRVPAFHLDGGRNNTTSWGGIPNNYPSSQYGDPVGFYGIRASLQPYPSSIGNGGNWASAGGVSYPAVTDLPVAAQRHRTDAPFVLSTYPVTIRGRFSDQSSERLLLRKGKLRALRNIMFSTNTPPHVSNNSSSTSSVNATGLSFAGTPDGGITANYLSAIESLVTTYGGEGTYGVQNNAVVHLENSEVGIRHLGFSNVAVGILAHNTTITAYNDYTIQTNTNVTNHYTSVLGSLDNSPVVCTNCCDTALKLLSCDVNFDDTSGGVNTHNYACRDHTVHLHGKQVALYARDTKFKAGTLIVDNTSLPVNFFALITPDSYTGLASNAGETRAHWLVDGNDLFYYKRATLCYQLPGESRKVIGLLGPAGNVLRSGSYLNWGADPKFHGVCGTTASATAIGGVAATNFGYVGFPAVLPVIDSSGGFSFADSMSDAMSYGNIASDNNSITRLLLLGGTLSAHWYYDLEGTSLASEWLTDRNSVIIKGANGVSLGYTGLTMPASAPATPGLVPSWYSAYQSSYGESGFGWGYSRVRKVGKNAVTLDSSKLTVHRGMWIYNGGYDAVLVENDSCLVVGNHYASISYTGYEHAHYDHFHHNSASLQVEAPQGYLCITGYDHCAVRVRKGSKFICNHLFVKHGGHSPFSATYNSYSRMARFVFAEQNSAVVLGTAACVGYPSHPNTVVVGEASTAPSNIGLWTGFENRWTASRGLLATPTTEKGFFRATGGSTIVFKVPNIAGAGNRKVIIHFDGGTADFTNARNASFFSVAGGGQIFLPPNDTMLYHSENLRTGADRKLHSRSPGSGLLCGIYNSNDQISNNDRWTGEVYGGAVVSGQEVWRRLTHQIGDFVDTQYGSGGIVPAAGLTHNVRVEDKYSAIIIQPLLDGYS